MGRPSGLVCFRCSCWNRWRGSMLPPDLVSILTWTEAVPLLLAPAGSFMTMHTSLHHWELMLSMIISFWCTSPTVLESIAAMNRSLCVGLFSVLALAACDSLLFSWLLNWGWWWDTCRLVVLELWHFACQWPFFPTNFTCWVSSRVVVSTGRVLMGAVQAWFVGCLWLWIMCLVGVAYSMYHMTCTHCSCTWFNSVVCSADL